jgi:hypothetical protein
LFATLTTDSLIPVPDFTLYQDQAETLDVLATRIDGLVRALQVRGVYDASEPDARAAFQRGQQQRPAAGQELDGLCREAGPARARSILSI